LLVSNGFGFALGCNCCAPVQCGTVCVTVKGCNGNGIGSGATVSALDPNGATVPGGPFTTDGTSRVCLPIYAPGTYTLTASPPAAKAALFGTGTVSLTAACTGSDENDVTVTLAPAAGYSCTGTGSNPSTSCCGPDPAPNTLYVTYGGTTITNGDPTASPTVTATVCQPVNATCCVNPQTGLGTPYTYSQGVSGPTPVSFGVSCQNGVWTGTLTFSYYPNACTGCLNCPSGPGCVSTGFFYYPAGGGSQTPCGTNSGDAVTATVTCTLSGTCSGGAVSLSGTFPADSNGVSPPGGGSITVSN
jgi:hypothetical protein